MESEYVAPVMKHKSQMRVLDMTDYGRRNDTELQGTVAEISCGVGEFFAMCVEQYHVISRHAGGARTPLGPKARL